MSDKPILFSGPMVRAQLAEIKTQTRRMLSLRGHRSFSEFGVSDTPGYDWHFRDSEMRWHDLRHTELLTRLRIAVGDRLWVKETWQAGGTDNGPHIGYRADFDRWQPPFTGEDFGVGPSFDYDAFPTTSWDRGFWLPDVEANGPWASPLHMPRWASRLTLHVTEVRVQRLQEISEEDARAEGIERSTAVPGNWRVYCETPMPFSGAAPTVLSHGRGVVTSDPRHSYATLWDSINGPGSWDANPWVAAYTFAVERCNIDQARLAA